jgi:hypothetical protein
LLSFLEFAEFVPAEGSIIECFEVFLVKFNCFRVVFYGILVFSLFPKREPPIMIKVSIIRFELYSFRKWFNSLVKISLAIQTDPFVVVSERIRWVNTDSSGIVLYGPIELTDLVESEATIK